MLFFTVTVEFGNKSRQAVHKGADHDYLVYLHTEDIDREKLTVRDNFYRYSVRLLETLLWEHKKGGLYLAIGIGYDLQSDEMGVVYESIDCNEDKWFFRPCEGSHGFFSDGRFIPARA